VRIGERRRGKTRSRRNKERKGGVIEADSNKGKCTELKSAESTPPQ
jgi:hypothetical protein